MATNFSEADTPVEFATVFTNRFVNGNGAAEKREGIGSPIDTIAGASLDGIHELIGANASADRFVSGRGRIFKWNGSAHTEVHSVSDAGKLRSDQFDDKLIFYNGVDRDFFTTDGSAFSELRAIVEQGKAASVEVSAGEGHFTDPEIVNWITGTDVSQNDMVFYVALDAYGAVTAVTSSEIAHDLIATSATGVGVASRTPVSGDNYEILDMVELNIIPTDGLDDNVATAGTGTGIGVVAVSGVDFSTTEIRVGDFIRNSTRATTTRVTSISANVNVNNVAMQGSGDALVFLKSAMPISSFAHVHYGRRYSVDSRDKRKIRISGANDPTDMTTDAGTLDAITFSFGTQQPEGNTVVSLSSFQNFFVMAGTKAVMLFEGTDPIGGDFSPVGLFPQGVSSPDSIASTGNDAAFMSVDGLQSLKQVADSASLNRVNLSEPVKNQVRELVGTVNQSTILVRHYPKRSWVVCKLGSALFVYNYGAIFTPQGFIDRFGSDGSWSIFDGGFANQSELFVQNDGNLITVDTAGRVFEFDQGVFNDNGANIRTEYQTTWLSTEEPRKFVSRKAGKYIKPIVEADKSVLLTIRADANYEDIATDTVTVTTTAASQQIGNWIIGTSIIGAAGVSNVKVPLRWNGEVVRLNFSTDDTAGPDVLDRYTIYSAVHGKR